SSRGSARLTSLPKRRSFASTRARGSSTPAPSACSRIWRSAASFPAPRPAVDRARSCSCRGLPPKRKEETALDRVGFFRAEALRSCTERFRRRCPALLRKRERLPGRWGARRGSDAAENAEALRCCREEGATSRKAGSAPAAVGMGNAEARTFGGEGPTPPGCMETENRGASALARRACAALCGGWEARRGGSYGFLGGCPGRGRWRG